MKVPTPRTDDLTLPSIGEGWPGGNPEEIILNDGELINDDYGLPHDLITEK